MGVVLITGVVAWWFLVNSGTVTFVSHFSEEVAALQMELELIEAEIVAGTLTPQAASAAQARIESRLTAITEASVSMQAETLTPALRAELIAGLEKLRQILITYQDTLQTVDEQVATLPAAERPLSQTGNNSVRMQIVTVIEILDEQLSIPDVDITELSTDVDAQDGAGLLNEEEFAALELDADARESADDSADTGNETEVSVEDESENEVVDETEVTSDSELEAELTTGTTS